MRISSAVSMRVGAMAALFIIVTGTAAGQYFRGVNVSQAEWGDPLNETYGIGNYTYATAPTFNYFAADEVGGRRAPGEADEDALVAPRFQKFLFHLVRGMADGEFAEGGEVGFGEEVVEGAARLLGGGDHAALDAIAQGARGERSEEH